MKPIYDTIGSGYARKRQPDPRIAEQLFKEFQGAEKILNIGAGSGSYEPPGIDLIALEPSQKMIDQRPPDAHPVIQGSAESLPFENQHFSHTVTVLSMHHWADRKQAFAEINRVTRDRFVALSWNPGSVPFWLTRDYFPEIFEIDQSIFPNVEEISQHFSEVEMRPLLVPEDCIDGFLAAYWKRPEAYLDQAVRDSISSFTKLKDVTEGLDRLRSDLESGAWHTKNESILHAPSLDAGYVLITGKTRNP